MRVTNGCHAWSREGDGCAPEFSSGEINKASPDEAEVEGLSGCEVIEVIS
jgi:hypothetical protein